MPKKITLADRIWTIVEYAPPVGTLLFATWIGLKMNWTGAKTDEIVLWILVIVILIATTQLMERARSLRLIRAGIDGLPDLLRRETKLFRRQSPEVDFRKLAKEATTIDVVGWSGVAFFNSHDGFLKDRIAAGCKVRLLVIDDDCEAAGVIMDNSEDKDLIDDIVRMKDRGGRFCEKIAGAPGSFEIRTVRWLVPFGLVIVDGNGPRGVISIGLHPIHLPTPRDERRFLLIDSAASMSDFTHFKQQFEHLWQLGEMVCSSAAPARAGDAS